MDEENSMRSFKQTAVVTAFATFLGGPVLQSRALAEGPDVLSDVVTAAGTGTITPGLPTTGCAVQTDITFTGTGVAVGDDGITAPARVDFDGDGGCETLGSGQGSGTLSGTFGGSINYQRSESIVQLSGNVNANGGTDSVGMTVRILGTTAWLQAICIFVPTSVNPVISYALVCAVALQ
jgi:hypothetical protein